MKIKKKQAESGKVESLVKKAINSKSIFHNKKKLRSLVKLLYQNSFSGRDSILFIEEVFSNQEILKSTQTSVKELKLNKEDLSNDFTILDITIC